MGVSTTGLKKGLASSTSMLTGFQSEISKTSNLLTGVFAATGLAAATAAMYKLVTAGSDLVENQNKIKATFGDASDIVINASNQMADAFGSSKKEFMDGAGVIGGILKNLGYGAGDAAQLSVQLVKLAGDIASFKNLSFDEALLKIRAGLTGESEPLKSIGILINETAVKTEAYAMGLAKVGAELNEQQKVQARLSILSKQTADAQGDLAKTADDVANATRGLQGRFENLIAVIGEQLQPIAKNVLGELSTAISAAGMAWDDYGMKAISSSVATTGAVGQQAQSMGFLQKAIGFIADAWDVVRLGFAAVQSYVTAGVGKMIEALAYLSAGFDKIAEGLGFAKTGATEFLNVFAEDLKNLSNKQWDGFQKKLTEPWPSESINDYFAKAKAKTEGLRKELGKAGFNPNAFKPTAATSTPKKDKEIKFASAMLEGSSESTNAILRSRYSGGQTNKDAAKTAANTGRMVATLDKIADKLGAGGGADSEVWVDFA